MAVFVLGKNKKLLMPCSEKRARLLLSRNRAVVHLKYPFTIRLKDRVGGDIQEVHLKLDPGAKTTGIALGLKSDTQLKALFLAHLEHRGFAISEGLTQRRAFRRRRRNHLWYRPARFDNRTRKTGWLAPSIQHRVDSQLSWVKKLTKLCPISDIGLERVRFDIQKLANPEISGVGYQQGTLFGYEVKEYLLYKHNHTCAYCSGASKDPMLEVEHIQPKSKGGSNSVKNLVMACRSCNETKGSLLLSKWQTTLKKSTLDLARAKGIEQVLRGKWRGYRDTSAVNATRNALLAEVLTFAKDDIGVYTGTGSMTKFNRHKQNIPKDHALDALCVGENVNLIVNWQKPILKIKCTGRGAYKRTRLDKYGFPRGYLMRQKSVNGLQTGDMIKAVVTKGKKQGVYIGRVAVRKTGSFNIQAQNGLIQGIGHKCCTLIQRNSGYGFSLTKIALNNGEPRKVGLLPQGAKRQTLSLPTPEGWGLSRIMMKLDFLDFEQPIAELEAKIDELRHLDGGDMNLLQEIASLEEKRKNLTESTFKKLTDVQIAKVSRHPQRPYALDYISEVFTDFKELHGDRAFADDEAIVAGLARLDGQPVMVITQEKGRDTKEKIRRNFGMPRPEGYRKALRLMKMAERFGLPVVTFIDTPGAYPGINAEERGQSEAIARNLIEMAELKVPIICTVIGEGGSGGALAIGVGDVTMIMEYSTYSVISPEGCASILWKNAVNAADAAEALGITAKRLKTLGLVDEVIPEPLGGAHRDHKQAASNLKRSLVAQVNRLKDISVESLVETRYQRYMDYGNFELS